MDDFEVNFEIATDILELSLESPDTYAVRMIQNNPEENMEVENPEIMIPNAMTELQKANFQFVNKQKASSTLKKTEKDTNGFIQYLEAQNEKRKPEKIPGKELDVFLGAYMS